MQRHSGRAVLPGRATPIPHDLDLYGLQSRRDHVITQEAQLSQTGRANVSVCS